MEETTVLVSEKNLIIDLIKNKKHDLVDKKENLEKSLGFNCLNAGSFSESIKYAEEHATCKIQIKLVQDLLNTIYDLFDNGETSTDAMGRRVKA